jgi:adenylyltransferase/sulfurtransferase
MPKADSAKLTLGEFNSEVQVNAHNERLNAKNVQNIIKNYDIVIDAVDNFEARYVINEACVKLKRPMVSGAVLKYQGQLSVFNCSNSPCYSCVYPVPPPEDVAPKGSVAGILGMIPGVIGTMQALEAVKLITGLGEPLVRKLLIFDGLTGRMRTLEVKRDLKCRVCGAGN